MNRAAVNGGLCHRANEARFLIGRAPTTALKAQRWSKDAIMIVREPQKQLLKAGANPHVDRAAQFCADGAKLIADDKRLKPDFAAKSYDCEAVLMHRNTLSYCIFGRNLLY